MVKDVLDRATLVMGGTVLTDMLNAPVAELAMCEYIYFPQYFFNCRSLLDISIRGRTVLLWDSRIYLLLLNAVFENILNYQAPRLS